MKLLSLALTIVTAFASIARAEMTPVEADRLALFGSAVRIALDSTNLECVGSNNTLFFSPSVSGFTNAVTSNVTSAYVETRNGQPAVVLISDWVPGRRRVLAVVTDLDHKVILGLRLEEQASGSVNRGDLVNPVIEQGYTTFRGSTCGSYSTR